MKNIIKSIGLITLICFSFFYTEKVINVINEQDPIMIKINNMKDNFKQAAVDASIDDDEIIPGIYGREVDVNISYNNMRKIGIYNESLYSYKDIKPKISLEDNYDKYITSGNPNKLEVALIIKLVNDTKLEDILKIIEKKQVTINFFIDYTYLNKNINEITKIKRGNFYSYGNNGTYTPDILVFSNNLLSRIGNNKANYCLSKQKDTSLLELCKSNNMHTIIPTIEGGYLEITNNLSSGNIISIDTNYNNLSKLENIIDFINKKGYNIVSLEQLLEERRTY